MKIYTICDYNIPFEVASTTSGIKGLEKHIPNCEVIIYDWQQAISHQLDSDHSSNCIYLADIGKAQHAGISSEEIRKLYPNGKIIVLASDTHWYYDQNIYQWGNPDHVDLHLETMPCFAKLLKEKYNLQTDIWLWTISESYMTYCMRLAKTIDYDRKKYSFIGVYHPYTVVENYRFDMINYIQSNQLTFTRGNGNGHNDKNIDDLFEQYLNSWITLGTTSHNDQKYTRIGSMKGFRDWIGPCLNCPLIYDSHDNIKQLFCTENNELPLYEYGNFQQIVDLYHKITSDHSYYEQLIKNQQNWLKNNTIEKHLYRILKKYNYV